jgi:protein-tyrosine-phosphatase
LSVDDIADADLILTLEREHRGAVVALVPFARDRAFTLIEAARLAAAIVAPGHALDVANGRRMVDDPLDELSKVPPLPTGAAGRATWLVSEMNVWRGQIGALTSLDLDDETHEDSIPDPHMISVSHSVVAAKIVSETRSLATSVVRCVAR